MTRYYHENGMTKTEFVLHDCVRVGAKHRITIPSRIATALPLKEGGYVLMRLVERELELLPIPKDQLWFWTPEWQKKEREADEEIAQGNLRTFDSVEELLKDLSSTRRR
jgi:AbrB family looped-hinge helix DNA binding protein